MLHEIVREISSLVLNKLRDKEDLYENFKDDLLFNGEKKVLDNELKKAELIRASNRKLMSLIAEAKFLIKIYSFKGIGFNCLFVTG